MAELARLYKIAPTRLPVMVIGETGTGKELVARTLHERSARDGPFVAVNCGALPTNLVESQLFGHVKGAFTGAARDEIGLVRSAHRGTLLLDEIGELPTLAQAALLRVLQEGEVQPVGATTPIPVDVRIVCATHQPLRRRIDDGSFRADLFARLAGYVFELPPLRDRVEDLGLIIATLLERHDVVERGALRLRASAGEALLGYRWPHNIRELEQALLAAVALCEERTIRLTDLPQALRDSAREATPGSAALSTEDQALRDELIDRLRNNRGNISATAREMGKARQQVQRWMKRLVIERDDYEG
jgi:DNA-binding NtrC family response regulator